MAYDIIFVEKDVDGPREKERGEGSVFLSGLPTDAKVFAFFYPGSGSDTDEVESRLRELGRRTGRNLFINIGNLDDPDYNRAEVRFNIGRLPVIIVTAISPLAATPDDRTAFVRLDRNSLFSKPEELIRTVQQLFNLFLGGKVARAIVTGWARQSKTALLTASEQVWAAIEPVIEWAARTDFTFDFAAGKIEVKHSRGH